MDFAPEARLCEAGFDVWGFDFQGFGHSDRYPEMDEPPEAHGPPCRGEEASEQVEAVVRFILDQHSLGSLSLIAHSWGSLPAGRLAGRHPRLIDRVVLFAPIARRRRGGTSSRLRGRRGASSRYWISGHDSWKTCRLMKRR